MSRPRLRSRLVAAFAPLLLIVGAALSGCAGQESAAAGSVTDDPLPTEVPDDAALAFADQSEVTQTLMQASGAQEKLQASVEYANFQGGPEILEAMRSGSIDLAYVGDTPPIQAQASGETILIVGALRTSAPDYQLAVRPGLSVKTLEDLDGTKIAYAEGTGRQPFILRALAEAGLTKDDVTLVPLSVSEFPDAVRTGEVDVAPINEPTISHYLDTPGATKVPPAQLEGLSNGLHYVYATADALSDPAKAAAISDFVTQWVYAEHWATQNVDEWVQAYYVDTVELAAADGKAVLESQGEVTFPRLDEETIAKQQDTIDVIHDAGELPEELDAAEEFDTRFEPVVQAAVKKVGATRGEW